MNLYNVYDNGILIKELTECRRDAITKYFGYTIMVADFINNDRILKDRYKFEYAGETEPKTAYVCKIKPDDPFWSEWEKARLRINPVATRRAQA